MHGEIAWFSCVKRLCDFSQSLTHSGCMIYFFWKLCKFFFAARLCEFFVERLRDFFVWRGCLIFFVKRLHDFGVKRFFLVKISFMVKQILSEKKIESKKIEKKKISKTFLAIFLLWNFFCEFLLVEKKIWKKKFFCYYCYYCHYCHIGR